MKKENLKKFLAVGLASVMVLTACSSNQTAEEPKTEEPTTVELPYNDGKFQLFDESGNLIRTGRDGSGENGVVSTSKYEASLAGLEIIEKGGNAIDAAVAAGFVLGVVEPQSSGIGGGGFMTLRDGETGETVFIDFREIAPAAATPEMWKLDAEGKVVDNENMVGGKSTGVPGEVAGLIYALETYGTMSLGDVMAPAIAIAEGGYQVSPSLANDINDTFANFETYPEGGKIFLKDGLPYEVGDVIVNQDLANTLKKIAEEGKDGFYKGEIAEKMVKANNEAGGLMTMADLENYKVEVVEPVKGTYRGYEIISSPPPSSGGTHIIEILNILENYDIGAMEVNSKEYLHLFSESFKQAFADRGAFMGDTNFVDVPLKGLTSKDYAKTIVEKIDLEKASVMEPGDPWIYEHEDTTHYSIADKAGNMVSVTKTINGLFGSAVMGEGTGFMLNNEMGDFSPDATSPNAIAPNKKPLSSMSPTIVLKDGEPFMVLGSPGATRIITTVAQVISRVIDHDMAIQEAIDAPRIFDNTANLIKYENNISEDVIAELEAMGHPVEAQDAWARYFGSVQGILYKDGTIYGGADPRRDGKAVGY